MRILKHIYFIYLFIAVVFIYDGIVRINENLEHPWLSFLIALFGVGMFFFRKKYSKKFEDHYSKK